MADPLDRLSAALAERYRLERELGAGGMATVYLAEDLKHHRQVALKVLRPELSALLGAERFLKEIELTANLQHPHLLPLFDSGSAAGLLYYVMPYVAGESLRAKLTREKQLGVEEAVRLTTQVASALDYAHRRNVIHRDIKPENILLHEGQALIADFGIALALRQAGGNRLTETGLSLGTPQYMSPEQATGDRQLDARSDIYSLGCVLYEMLAGEPPHTGPTVQAVVAKVLAAPVTPIGELRGTVPVHVAAALEVALAKLPADRWGSAGDFAAGLTLEGYSRAFPRAATRDKPGAGRARAFFPLLGGVGALALAVVWLAFRSPAVATVDPRYWDLALPDSAPLAFAGPAPIGIWQRAVTISRDGKTVAYVARHGATTRLLVRHIDSGVTRDLPGTEGAYFPFFSPDGQWIGFFVMGDLKRIAVTGGTAATVATGFTEAVGAVWYSPDSILVGDKEGNAPAWISPSGRARQDIPTKCVAWVDCGSALDPEILPGAEWAIGGGGFLMAVSLKGEGMRVLTTSGPVPLEDADPGTALRGWSPKFVPPRYLVFMPGEGTELHGVEFDPKTLRIKGNTFRLLDGIRREQLYTAGQFALSDEGTLVYASGVDAAVATLGWVDASGRLDTLPFVPGPYGGVSLRRDGMAATVTRGPLARGAVAEVLVLDLRAGRTLCTVSFPRSHPTLIWYSDGTVGIRPWDAFLQLRTPEPSTRMSVDNCRPVPLEGSAVRPSAVSPDGAWVAFTDPSDSAVLRHVRDSTAAGTPIGPAGWSASFSPDSRWLAFTVYGSPNKIVVIPVPYDGRRFEVASDEGDMPRWFPDGRRLAYKRGREYMVVDLQFRDGRVEASRPRVFVEGPFPRVLGWSYDIGPDGRILTVVNAEEVATRQIKVIVNFRELVRRMAGQGSTQ